MVIAYSLCDSADYRYSIGIHTVWVRFLDNGEPCALQRHLV
jgi:hypothetical protein